MESAVLFNNIQRVGRAIRREISLGNKILDSPTMAPKVKKPMDFKIVCDLLELEKRATAVVFEIQSMEIITQQRRRQSKQYDLSMKIVDKNWGQFFEETPIIIDPRTEAFYWKIPTGKDKYLKEELLQVIGFQRKVRDVLDATDSENYNGQMKALMSQGMIPSYVDSYVGCQAKLGCDVILPPTPLITGSDQSLEVMVQVNDRTLRLVREGKMKSCAALYAPMHNRIFKDGWDNARESILDYISQKAPSCRLLFLKMAYYGQISGNKLARIRYREFLSSIDEIKRKNNDQFAVFLLDAGLEGAYGLMNGLDVYSCPMDGVIGFRMGGQKEDEVGNEKHGGYLYPTYGSIAFNTLLTKIGEKKILPCNCSACAQYQGTLSKETPTYEWNLSRRAHLVNTKLGEIDVLTKAMEENRLGDIVFKIDRGEDRNAIDLIPPVRSTNYIDL